MSRIQAAQAAWTQLSSRKYLDDRLAADYTGFLLRNHLYDTAPDGWAAYLAGRRGDYPRSQSAVNASYETNPTGSVFDWRIEPSGKVDTVRDQTDHKDGNWSIHITFHDDDNVAYDNIMQTARVHGGPHSLTAWVRTDDITTNEGIRLRLFDAENPARMDYRTDPITGTHEWMPINEVIRIPDQTNLVTIEICRNPSTKFDNKIAGSAWIDQVSLRPSK